jgi:hypothetical protein
MSEYKAEAAAAFYDDYADREWTRFEDGRSPVSFEIHRHYLHRFVRPKPDLRYALVRLGNRARSRTRSAQCRLAHHRRSPKTDR